MTEITHFSIPFDRPVTDPDDDLLDMKSYAYGLAKFILGTKPPFTIGIHGEWGTGKTTLVHFVEQFLRDESANIKFINFSAWPHTTADDLWHALILKIARSLYAINEAADTINTSSKSINDNNSMWETIASLLQRKVVFFDSSSSINRPLTGYEKVVSKLNDLPLSSISKDHDYQLRLDHEEMLMAIANVFMTALGTMSPLVGTVKQVLGFESNDFSRMFRQKKNESTIRKVESISAFQELFNEIVDDTVKGSVVCVFIDDLDRCTPNVALDVLEAIKILLHTSPCIFIVAADETLIGQGLRIRYHDVYESLESLELKQFLDKKGTEYFEKIIQMRFRIPPRSSQQAHKYVSAQYPQWVAATDLLQAAIGYNPRRLNQYSEWLRYLYHMTEVTEALSDGNTKQ